MKNLSLCANTNRLPRQTQLRSLLAFSIFVSSIAAQATTLYWQGLGSGTSSRQWNGVANWSVNSGGGSPNQLPSSIAPGDDIVIGNLNDASHTLNTRPTPGTWYANSLTFTCNGFLMVNVNTTNDLVVIGPGGIINNPGNIAGAGASLPNPPINEFRCNGQLGANATLMNYDINQPFKFRTLDLGTNKLCLNLKNFTLTLDGAGTNNFSTPTIGTGGHWGGTIGGTGGIIKNGTGSTSFSSSNSYTGPTMVNAGQLIVKTWSLGGGSYAVADGGSLQVTVGSAGTTLNTSSLNLTNTTGAANTNTLTIALSSLGNPTVPVVHATNLTLNGTVYVNVTGSGLAPGTIPLIQYDGSIAGGGTLVTNSIPAGVGAYLTNNTSAKQFQLVVLSVPSLVWVGKTNSTLLSTWDIGVNTNWFDTSSGNQIAFVNGLPVRFDDTGFTNLVTLATNVVPFSITVSNNAKIYTLTNDGINGYQANPSSGYIKDGPGKFIIGITNSFSGGFTFIKQGTIQAAAAFALGRGTGQSGAALTNNGILDLNGFQQNVGTLDGTGLITNSSSTPVTFSCQAGATAGGTFSGKIVDGPSGGAVALYKSGGELTLSGQNTYSGGTHIITGGSAATRWLVLGGNNVIGTGPLVFEINSTLTPDSSPRTLTNSISDQNINAGISLGSPGAGLLTLSGPFDISAVGGDQALTCPSDVVISGPLTTTSGGLSTKDGSGTLRLLNNTCNLINLTSDARVNDGSLIIDGESVSLIGVTAPLVRVQSQLVNGLASLYLTNSASLAVGNVNGYYRLRLGDTTSPTNAFGVQSTTNIVDIRGSLVADGVTLGYSGQTITTNNPGPSETYVTNWNGGGAYARLSLQPGSQTTLNQISASPTKTITEVNLDGATINVFDGASSSFLQGLTNVFIKSGGVTLNGANTNSIHIRQNLLAGGGGGGGGLIWNGTNDGNGLAGIGIGDGPQATTLQLDGTNTYNGTTTINIGTLGGIGTLAGPLVFANGTQFQPGGGGNIGNFTVNNSVTFNSGTHCSFELNTTNSLAQTDGFGNITNYVPLLNTNDMLVVSGTLSITAASLTVNNLGPALTNGNSFKLFSKAAVGFTSITLPALDPSLMWQTNLTVDGSIAVVSTNNVVVTPPTLNVTQTGGGNALHFTWSNGSGSFHLQSQTNALNTGLNANWFNYPGGGSSPVDVNINPANPTVFFRLSQ